MVDASTADSGSVLSGIEEELLPPSAWFRIAGRTSDCRRVSSSNLVAGSCIELYQLMLASTIRGKWLLTHSA